MDSLQTPTPQLLAERSKFKMKSHLLTARSITAFLSCQKVASFIARVQFIVWQGFGNCGPGSDDLWFWFKNSFGALDESQANGIPRCMLSYTSSSDKNFIGPTSHGCFKSEAPTFERKGLEVEAEMSLHEHAKASNVSLRVVGAVSAIDGSYVSVSSPSMSGSRSIVKGLVLTRNGKRKRSGSDPLIIRIGTIEVFSISIAL